MIVFTIYRNGGNAGVLGASFSCAVFGVRGSSGGNAGARSAGRALFNGGGFVGFEVGKRFSWSFCRRASGRAVLIEDAGAFVRSFVRSFGRYRMDTPERAGGRWR